MAGDIRRDPEVLLKKANKESRGRLTVFLGAAAGVGKTYAMLENARERLSDGIDVVIGWIETHGRRETEAMAVGLPRLETKDMEYRGKVLQELDVDAVLARRPQLVLIDELAHTNITGSRHIRRFQDVEEILTAGISVYTTLNIQHVESMNDIVEQITQVKIRETVPDWVIETADQVQLIDIPPDDLIKRLKEGKVYIPGQAEQALQNFFRPGNINALRELSLRFTAHRVDREMNEYMHDHSITGPWAAAEKVMVCVSSSPFSAHLIRVAKRMATAMKSEWYAVYVETLGKTRSFDKDRERLTHNLHLAQELGGKIATLSGRDVVEEMVAFALEENVTHIVVGKPLHNPFWEWLHGGALVDNLIRKSGGIQIHVIQGNKSLEYVPKVETTKQPVTPCWPHYGGGLAMMLLITLFCLMMPAFELVNVAMLYLLPVLLSAAWWGRGPSYATALCTVAVFDYLFVPPVLSFSVMDVRYIWSFLIFLLVAFVAGGQTERLRQEAKFARKREKMTRALYEFSREIAASVDLESVITGLVGTAAKTLQRSVAVFLPDSGGKLLVKASETREGGQNDLSFDPSELAVATWAFEHAQIAGCSTETLPSAQFLYLPLNVRSKALGVLGVSLEEKNVTPEQRRLIDAWAALAAIAVERIHLAAEASQTALLEESERLRTALLNSVSHELRTPLATILGSVSTLLDQDILIAPSDQKELLSNIQEGASRMERIIVNLLDIARLESGAMKIKRDWCDIEDIVGAALHRLHSLIKERKINITISEELPLFQGDCVLLEQVVVNLLDNALKYSTPDQEITVGAVEEEDKLVISVADRGIGVSASELEQIFNKFYRAKSGLAIGGTGLGLSICKGIIEAHGGTIWAVNRMDGGTCFFFTLPLAGSKLRLQ